MERGLSVSKDMKLIMESWRKNVLTEQALPDCATNNVPMFTLLIAMGLWNHLDDEKKAIKIARKKLDQIGAEKSSGILKTILAVTGLVAAGVSVVAPPAAPAALAAKGAIAGAASAAAAYTAEWMEKSRDKKVRQGNAAAKKIFRLFCIDDETLDLIADKYESAYIHTSGVMEQIEKFVERSLSDHTLQFPDLTKHLVNWINTQTPYKDSDASEMEFKR